MKINTHLYKKKKDSLPLLDENKDGKEKEKDPTERKSCYEEEEEETPLLHDHEDVTHLYNVDGYAPRSAWTEGGNHMDVTVFKDAYCLTIPSHRRRYLKGKRQGRPE